MKRIWNLFRSFSILLLLAGLASVLFQACSLKPLAWQPAAPPAFEGAYTLNTALQNVEQIDLQGWYGPEDIVQDDSGYLYCGVHRGASDFSDGKILRIAPDGTLEIFYDAGSWVAGLHLDSHGNLIALSHREGLISISPDKEVQVLADQDEQGRPFRIPNGLDIASDGMIYFSNTAHEAPYSIKYGRKLILEMKVTGGLYQYNPTTGKVTTLIDGTYFGNGVVLSQDESYLLLVETTRYRVLRYWLSGEKQGTSEVFIDNLPGFPNGISIRQDGSFWLGFTTVRNEALDKIHPHKGMKRFVYGLPEFLQPQQELFGMVMNLSESGEILEALFDPTGAVVPEAGAVKEYKGHLYLGGDVTPYISRYPLSSAQHKPLN